MRLDEGDHRALVLWATDCVEHVLPVFEERYPQDQRPRYAVEAGRAWARGEIVMREARAAGHAAATAHAASHAAHAATYAVTAASSAAEAADEAAVTAKEREWQYGRLPQHLRPVAFPARGDD